MEQAQSDTVPARSATDWQEAIERVLADPSLIDVHFQPIADLNRGVACGYEMLARFPTEFDATPDIWFAQAARIGKGDELNAALTRKAMERRGWLPANSFISVNVDPESLGSGAVQDEFSGQGQLDAVVVELTEHSRIGDDEIEEGLGPVRELGGLVALDDVGAGYSGLHRVIRLRPDFLKIDRSIVSGLDADKTKVGMLESIGAVANQIDAWVVVEGVETEAELDTVISIGVPLAQGFHISRPGPSMTDIEPGVADHIGEVQEFCRSDAQYAELISRVKPLTESEGDARSRFELDRNLNHLPVVDGRGRPVRLIPRELDRGEPNRPMLIGRRSQLELAARRAMAREPGARFDPLVYCDENGRYVGLVPIEALVEALASKASGGF